MAIAKSPKLKLSLDDFDTNALGFVRRSFSTKECRFTAYYASVPKTPVVRPLDGSKWYEEMLYHDPSNELRAHKISGHRRGSENASC